MTGRSPARLLAPLALVTTAVALFVVVTSGERDAPPASPAGATTTTTEPASEQEGGGDGERRRERPRRYTVRPGDTPSGIAERLDVPLDDLLAANPEADPNSLTPGQKLELP